MEAYHFEIKRPDYQMFSWDLTELLVACLVHNEKSNKIYFRTSVTT